MRIERSTYYKFKTSACDICGTLNIKGHRNFVGLTKTYKLLFQTIASALFKQVIPLTDHLHNEKWQKLHQSKPRCMTFMGKTALY